MHFEHLARAHRAVDERDVHNLGVHRRLDVVENDERAIDAVDSAVLCTRVRASERSLRHKRKIATRTPTRVRAHSVVPLNGRRVDLECFDDSVRHCARHI